MEQETHTSHSNNEKKNEKQATSHQRNQSKGAPSHTHTHRSFAVAPDVNARKCRCTRRST